MSLWRQLAAGIRVLVNRRAVDRDLADEIEHYFELTVAAHRARGLSPADAHRAARIDMGNAAVVREHVRGYGWENIVSGTLADFRFAARRLRNAPGFTTVAAITLALGIGASTTIFSAVDPIILEPLPYRRAADIVAIWDRSGDGARLEPTFGTYRELSERATSLERLAVMRPWQPTLTGATIPERLEGQRVTAGYFDVLGVSPALGRGFRDDEDRPGAPRVAILGHGFWRRRFGADSALLDQAIVLDDVQYTIIGIMPAAFENVLAPEADLWTPLRYDPSLPADGPEWGHHLRMVGRLRVGNDAARAGRELDAIARTPVPEFARPPWASFDDGLLVTSLKDDLIRGVRPVLFAVLGAVMLLLVIACVNVTNLLLARGARQRGELAMRIALGAGRIRLIRQMLAESLLIAAIGGALGLIVAWGGVQGVVALTPAAMPRAHAIALDGSVLAFAIGVTALVGLVVGVIPALAASRTDLHVALQRDSRRTAGGRGRARSTLVVVEVALALVLLTGAGLLLRSLERLFAIEPGFDSINVLTTLVQTSGRRLESDSATDRFFAEALAAVRDVPGVESAGFTSQLPLSGDADVYGVRFESAEFPSEAGQGAFRHAVTPGYLETLGIPLRAGRMPDARDVAGASPSVLINESFAKRMFGNRSPIGDRLLVGGADTTWSTIVGVVGDVRHASLAAPVADAVYVPTTQWPFPDRARWLVVRARTDPVPLAAAIRGAIWSVDPNQPIVRVAAMRDLLADSTAERRFALLLFEAFALAALMLAATGIYGVVSGGVAERRREIGVRAALGATPLDIVLLVLRRGVALAAIGVALGLPAAIAASRGLGSLLFEVSGLDAVTYVSVSLLLFAVAGVACWLPAARAAHVDPSLTLRVDG